MIDAAAAIVFDEDRVLLVLRPEGLWSVPGGKVEPGEAIPAAVAREVLEETGLVVEVGPLAEIVEVRGYRIHDHVARVVGGTLAAASDARDARWVSLAALDTLPTTEDLADVLARARATHAAWFRFRS